MMINISEEELDLKTIGEEFIASLIRRKLLRRQQKHNWAVLMDVLQQDHLEAGFRNEVDNILEKVRRVGTASRQEVEGLNMLYSRQFAELHSQIQKLRSQINVPSTSANALRDQMSQSDDRVSVLQPPTSARPPPAKRPRAFGHFDVPARKQLCSLRGEAKLSMLKTIRQEIDAMPEGEGFCNALRVFENQVLSPALRCLENHCNGDEQQFVQRWGQNFRTSKFSSTCCSGRGSRCGSQDSNSAT